MMELDDLERRIRHLPDCPTRDMFRSKSRTLAARLWANLNASPDRLLQVLCIRKGKVGTVTQIVWEDFCNVNVLVWDEFRNKRCAVWHRITNMIHSNIDFVMADVHCEDFRTYGIKMNCFYDLHYSHSFNPGRQWHIGPPVHWLLWAIRK